MIFNVNQNVITAYGTIWSGNGMDFVSLLAQVESRHKEITVKLHTYGGSVFDGNLMANALRDSKSKIRLEIVGIAASMGFVISLYLEDVYMVANGFLMAHAPSGYTEGTALDHENNAKMLRSIESNFLKIVTKKTGKTESYVKKWLVGDNWLDATEAKKEGLIKDIIDPETETEILDPKQLGIAETYNRFTALLNPKKELQINLDHTMKKPIIEALSLASVNEQSSDTAVIEAVKQHFEGKITIVQNELNSEKQKRIDLETKFAAQNKAAIDAVIARAKDEGKITAEEIATYEAIATASGVETLNVVLAKIPVRKTISGQMQASDGKVPNAIGKEGWDFDKWQKEDPRGLEVLSKESPEEFEALFNQKYKK